MPKTKEELEQLKKEYQKLTEQASQLTDEELENVTGGTCDPGYSDFTYEYLGIQPSLEHNQIGTYHPFKADQLSLACSLYSGNTSDSVDPFPNYRCKQCVYFAILSEKVYGEGVCKARSLENDPFRK